MLSLFPSLFAYEQLAPTLIRLVLGSILLYWFYKGLKDTLTSQKRNWISVVEGVAGGCLIVGYLTQLAALIVIVDMGVRLVQKGMRTQFLTDGVNYYLLVLVMALTLMFTGAGLMAFDLPL